MVAQTLRRMGLRSTHFQLAGTFSVGLCLSLWIRAKTMDQEQRDNAERRAIFVGLWPPTLWLVGNALQQLE